MPLFKRHCHPNPALQPNPCTRAKVGSGLRSPHLAHRPKPAHPHLSSPSLPGLQFWVGSCRALAPLVSSPSRAGLIAAALNGKSMMMSSCDVIDWELCEVNIVKCDIINDITEHVRESVEIDPIASQRLFLGKMSPQRRRTIRRRRRPRSPALPAHRRRRPKRPPVRRRRRFSRH